MIANPFPEVYNDNISKLVQEILKVKTASSKVGMYL